MAIPEEATGSHHDSLDAVIADYVQQVEAGAVPDREALLAQHPDLADGLREFFADFDRLDCQAAALRLPGDGTEPPGALPQVRYFGEYELLEVIARGGMGVVYKARQASLNRVVALKMILRGKLATPRDVARFRAEAEAAANLDHPHIVPIYEVGEHEGQQYYAMRFIEGASLARQPRGDLRGEVGLMTTVARAVHYAHQHGILHRDIKPSNILLAGLIPFITDFGLAKRLDHASDLTGSGETPGTPRYMAPEQAAGRKDLTVAADVYSLGVVLYERLTGTTPFSGDDVLELLRQHREAEPPRPSARCPGLDRDLETVCLKCLEKEPAKRYGSAQELADDLERWLRGEPILARPVGSVGRLTRWCRRNPVVAGLSTALALSLVFGAAIATLFAVQATRETNRVGEAKRLSDRRLYVAHMILAGRAWEDNQIERLRELLNRQLPEQSGGLDLRGFEWYYWHRRCLPEILTLQVHPFGVNDIAFSPDGTLLAAAGGDGTLKVWESATSKEVLSLTSQGHTSLTGIAFHPAGKLLATAGEDGTVQILELATGKPTAHVQKGERVSGQFRVAFSPDGRYLAYPEPEWGGTVKVWDLATGQIIKSLKDDRKGNSGDIAGYGIAFSPDGKQLASAHQNVVTIWDLATGDFRQHLGISIRALAFASDGKKLALGSQDGPVALWSLVGDKKLPFLQGHSKGVNSVAFSPDGRRLASASDDGTVKVWALDTGQEMITLKGHSKAVTRVAFHPDGRRLASASKDGTVKIWDTTSVPTVFTYEGAQREVSGVAFHPDGSRLAAACNDQKVRVWDVASGQELFFLQGQGRLQGPDRWVRRAVFSPDGNRLASAGYDKAVRVWDLGSGKEVFTLRGHTSFVYSVAFSPDGKHLASSGNEATVRLWDLATGEETRTLQGHTDAVFEVAFSPDGRRLATASADKTVRVWEAGSGRQTLMLHGTTFFSSVVFSPDDKWLASGEGKIVQLWDAATGERRLTLRGHTGTVWSVVFTPDGQRLASGSSDGTVKLWDSVTGEEVLTLKGHTREVVSVAFSPDGTRLASASNDGTVRIWDARP